MSRKATVLVIDADDAMLELTWEALRQLNVDVIGASDGESGVKIAADRKPDLILLDLHLPDGHGFNICHRLKRNIDTAAIPVIFLTDDQCATVKARSFEVGGSDYVTKPINNAELKARVSSTLRTRSLVELLDTQARTDQLTGLPNRLCLIERLSEVLIDARYNSEHRFALLFIDCDRFKTINDSLGHDVGDQLLVHFADRLSADVNTGNVERGGKGRHLAVRLGGDEFILLLDHVESREQVQNIATRMQSLLSAPYHIAGKELSTTVSIGIVYADAQYNRPEEIIRDADIAMGHAKALGKATQVMFSPQMHEAAVRRHTIEHDLRKALDRDELLLHYQPIHSLIDRSLIGFETLLRWQHPTQGLVSPLDFIPLAEESGLIVPIGAWVMTEACRQLRQWQAMYPVYADLIMNINVSKRQLLHHGFLEETRQTLERTRVRPQTVNLEITESVIMENYDIVTPVLNAIKELGPQLSMDDFGTGYSSLSCLHHFPIDRLKIDRGFIRNITQDRAYSAVLFAIVTLAHNLNLRVVAEGIETEDQLVQLQALECDYAQGFFFSKPLPVTEAEALLRGTTAVAQSA